MGKRGKSTRACMHDGFFVLFFFLGSVRKTRCLEAEVQKLGCGARIFGGNKKPHDGLKWWLGRWTLSTRNHTLRLYGTCVGVMEWKIEEAYSLTASYLVMRKLGGQ